MKSSIGWKYWNRGGLIGVDKDIRYLRGGAQDHVKYALSHCNGRQESEQT